jgi:hypothetical protein
MADIAASVGSCIRFGLFAMTGTRPQTRYAGSLPGRVTPRAARLLCASSNSIPLFADYPAPRKAQVTAVRVILTPSGSE